MSLRFLRSGNGGGHIGLNVEQRLPAFNNRPVPFNFWPTCDLLLIPDVYLVIAEGRQNRAE
ncbi:hypothetical protein PSAB_20970 [Paenibacillus sabinae T27]|uniref:Uncharacterized protein n=1 Tax=Paenibacillus sabinae T27 TaxID=1268072 RepID=X4ZRJ3_9BACL|nr:hypothetical protein PSAB_20970 [Paenibacillus sabinae T27]